MIIYDPKICDECGQIGHTSDNCYVYGNDSNNDNYNYNNDGYDSNENDWNNDGSDNYKSWICSFCDKEFDTLKGAKYHENVYCKKKLSHKKTKDNITNACIKCGRRGHKSKKCYATKHVKGYYLQ